MISNIAKFFQVLAAQHQQPSSWFKASKLQIAQQSWQRCNLRRKLSLLSAGMFVLCALLLPFNQLGLLTLFERVTSVIFAAMRATIILWYYSSSANRLVNQDLLIRMLPTNYIIQYNILKLTKWTRATTTTTITLAFTSLSNQPRLTGCVKTQILWTPNVSVVFHKFHLKHLAHWSRNKFALQNSGVLLDKENFYPSAILMDN